MTTMTMTTMERITTIMITKDTMMTMTTIMQDTITKVTIIPPMVPMADT